MVVEFGGPQFDAGGIVVVEFGGLASLAVTILVALV